MGNSAVKGPNGEFPKYYGKQVAVWVGGGGVKKKRAKSREKPVAQSGLKNLQTVEQTIGKRNTKRDLPGPGR